MFTIYYIIKILFTLKVFIFVVVAVMILGVLLAKKRYPIAKYFCVFLIVIGVALFLYKDVSIANSKTLTLIPFFIARLHTQASLGSMLANW